MTLGTEELKSGIGDYNQPFKTLAWNVGIYNPTEISKVCLKTKAAKVDYGLIEP